MTARDMLAGACVSCGGQLERIDELTLDVAGQDVPFYTDRCGVCLSEFVTAPDIFRDDAELLKQFRTRGPIGSSRRILSLASRGRGTRPPPGSRVASALLGHMLENDLADVVFLAHQGVAEEPVLAFTKGDLARVGEVRMGQSRAIFTGSQRRSNLLTLAQLRRFTEQDRGAHPRIAVMGRPCQIYTARKLLWDRYAPGYELAFALGLFCYGNFNPAWGGASLHRLLGFHPVEIRRVEFIGEQLRFTSSNGTQAMVGQDSVAGLVNPNCLGCEDFAASFSDVSVGLVDADDASETAIVRTELGERVVEATIREGLLEESESHFGGTNSAEEQRNAAAYLGAIAEIKKQLTRQIR